MSDLHARIAALWRFPVKSCAGESAASMRLDASGLADDRRWMVVDRHGRMLTQREHPRMALIRPVLAGEELELQAPGVAPLRVARADGPAMRVRVWDEDVDAIRAGSAAHVWLSDRLGEPAQLVRFAAPARRLADAAWTAGVQAPTLFSDGFPLLVCASASLAALNARLAAAGQAPVGIERFRPNLVLDGLEAFDEDHADTLEIRTAGTLVRLRLVKPCVRCTIPNVDPATGVQGSEPGATLAAFRADARMAGGITFGMNAIVLEGVGATLAVGQAVDVALAF